MPKKKKITKALTVSQKQELENWENKIKSGESIKKTKKFILECSEDLYDPEYKLEKIARKVMPKLRITKEKINDDDNDQLNQAALAFGFDNNLSIMEGIPNEYRSMMLAFKKKLIKEYNCQTVSEKALVDMIVSAYAKNLLCTKKLIGTIKIGHTTHELNNFMSLMSKESDRANRHFLTALETLRQFKQPEMKINIKSKNAFISQNQQINTNPNKPNEIIEPK